MSHLVDIAATLADHQERVDDAAGALARLPHGPATPDHARAFAAYAAAQQDLRRFRDRWCRGGRGVRGGTV